MITPETKKWSKCMIAYPDFPILIFQANYIKSHQQGIDLGTVFCNLVRNPTHFLIFYDFLSFYSSTTKMKNIPEFLRKYTLNEIQYLKHIVTTIEKQKFVDAYFGLTSKQSMANIFCKIVRRHVNGKYVAAMVKKADFWIYDLFDLKYNSNSMYRGIFSGNFECMDGFQDFFLRLTCNLPFVMTFFGIQYLQESLKIRLPWPDEMLQKSFHHDIVLEKPIPSKETGKRKRMETGSDLKFQDFFIEDER